MSKSTTASEQQAIVDTFLQNAEQAASQGQEEEARAWLEGAVEVDENNVDAWLRLAQVIPDARERMECYGRVLALAPGDSRAKAGLRKTRREL
jgi:Tfp pilus assembly protein PilF